MTDHSLVPRGRPKRSRGSRLLRIFFRVLAAEVDKVDNFWDRLEVVRSGRFPETLH